MPDTALPAATAMLPPFVAVRVAVGAPTLPCTVMVPAEVMNAVVVAVTGPATISACPLVTESAPLVAAMPPSVLTVLPARFSDTEMPCPVRVPLPVMAPPVWLTAAPPRRSTPVVPVMSPAVCVNAPAAEMFTWAPEAVPEMLTSPGVTAGFTPAVAVRLTVDAVTLPGTVRLPAEVIEAVAVPGAVADTVPATVSERLSTKVRLPLPALSDPSVTTTLPALPSVTAVPAAPVSVPTERAADWVTAPVVYRPRVAPFSVVAALRAMLVAEALPEAGLALVEPRFSAAGAEAARIVRSDCSSDRRAGLVAASTDIGPLVSGAIAMVPPAFETPAAALNATWSASKATRCPAPLPVMVAAAASVSVPVDIRTSEPTTVPFTETLLAAAVASVTWPVALMGPATVNVAPSVTEIVPPVKAPRDVMALPAFVSVNVGAPPVTVPAVSAPPVCVTVPVLYRPSVVAALTAIGPFRIRLFVVAFPDAGVALVEPRLSRVSVPTEDASLPAVVPSTVKVPTVSRS